jgi:thiamine biosynthesis lipoprotein
VTRALTIVLLTAATLTAAAPRLVQRDAYLMGTRAYLEAFGADRAAGRAILETALGTLERTEQQLSTWRADSAISRLNRAAVGHPWNAVDDLCELFADLFHWQAATGGTFDPAIGALAASWNIHGSGAVPAAAVLDDARQRSGVQYLDFDRQQCTVTRRADVRIDVGAFGKGEALDRVRRVLPDATWMIDLGGQLAVNGSRPDGTPWIVPIAHPAERQTPILQVQLTSGSLSTSGGSERDLRVGDTRVGHILDPRTGYPAPFDGSVAVWHERALVADIVSTALYVMGPEQGLPWARARGIAAAFLILNEGSIRVDATPEFTTVLRPDATK